MLLQTLSPLQAVVWQGLSAEWQVNLHTQRDSEA